MSEPTTAAGPDYETRPSTRAGQQLVSTYTILTPFVRAIEAEARAAALDEARAAVASEIFDLPIGEDVTYSRGYSAAVAENRRSLLAAIDALRRDEG